MMVPSARACTCRYRKRVKKLTGVSSLPLSLVSEVNSSTGVHNSGLLKDKSVTLKTSNVATRVSERDLVNLVGVKPDFVLSTFENGCSKTFLELEGYCNGIKIRCEKYRLIQYRRRFSLSILVSTSAVLSIAS